MHQTALKYAKIFFETYCEQNKSEIYTIVEIGSQDVNGSLRDVAPVGVKYIGLDFVEGKGVDVVIEDPYKIPLPDNSADLVVTSSCFEHSEFFWLTFLEIARIVKSDGYIYVNAPSNGMYHKYPVDCWRFYPDSGNALAAWSKRSGYNIELVESFIGERSDENIWNDFVAVFKKKCGVKTDERKTIISKIENFTNAHTGKNFLNIDAHGYDYNKIANLNIELSKKNAEIATKNAEISDCLDKIEYLRSVERLKAEESFELVKLSKEYLQQIEKLKTENIQKNNEINSILKSKSWRVTYIFRATLDLIRSMKNKSFIQATIKVIYKKMPLPQRVKNILKSISYNFFGFLFKETEGYRHWIYIRELKKKLKSDEGFKEKKTNFRKNITRGSQNNILVIDTTTPTPDRDAGSLTAWYFLKSMVELGYSVDFIPADLSDLGKYTANINSIGVKTYSAQDIKTIEEYLIKAKDSIDVVFLYRVHTAASIFPLIKKYLPSAKIVFNTVDLHYLREEREAELNSDLAKKIKAKRTKEIEYKLMEESDVTIVLSEIEVELVRAESAKVNLKTIPLLMEVPGCKKDFDARSDVVFIGGFSHAPNADGIKYFIQKIWPLLKNHIDGGRLIIIGPNPPKELLDLCEGDDQIKILGYVENIEDIFDSCKLSIAPLRYGAGIKGKIGTSSSYGVPCIATSVAAEGMGMKNGFDLIIADKPEDFAKNLIEIYHNKEKWENISKKTIEFIEKNYSYSIGKSKIKSLLNELMGKHANSKKFLGVPSDGRISLLIELSSFDKGGLEKVVLDSALAFDKKRFEVTIVTAGKIGHLGEIAKESGLKVIGLNQKDILSSYDKLLNDNKFDVAISHFSDLGYRLFARYEIPNITFIHNVYAFFSNEQSNIFENNDRFVNRYISVSKNATRYAVGNLGVNEAKIETIANGLILSEHEERERRSTTLSRQDLGLSDSDYVFLNVASYNLHKGHYLMIDAMKHLLKMRDDVKILCVGNIVYEPHYKELVSYIHSEGLQEYIIMPGYIPDVAMMHRISDAFLLPSFIEGWSIAMNEAMFYKKPMILTNTGASAEVIENEDIGILIENEYGDVVDLNSKILDELAYKPQEYRTASILAKAMNRMATNRDDWKKRAEHSREKIYNYYDFNEIVKRYEKLIEEVFAQSIKG